MKRSRQLVNLGCGGGDQGAFGQEDVDADLQSAKKAKVMSSYQLLVRYSLKRAEWSMEEGTCTATDDLEGEDEVSFVETEKICVFGSFLFYSRKLLQRISIIDLFESEHTHTQGCTHLCYKKTQSIKIYRTQYRFITPFSQRSKNELFFIFT